MPRCDAAGADPELRDRMRAIRWRIESIVEFEARGLSTAASAEPGGGESSEEAVAAVATESKPPSKIACSSKLGADEVDVDEPSDGEALDVWEEGLGGAEV
jgi:hypothetical protein